MTEKLTKPTYPLTEAEDEMLHDHEEAYNCLWESYAEWKNEVAQFGYASFGKPNIGPITYPPELQVLVDKLEVYRKAYRAWETQEFETKLAAGEDIDEYIPF